MLSKFKKFGKIGEDWTIVILGLLIISLILLGLNISRPHFAWNSFDTLIHNVFSTKNLIIIFNQFFLLFFTLVLANLILRKRIRSLFFIIPFIFLLTFIALVIAGHESVKNYNLEAVIFSLSIGLLIGNFFTLPKWFKDSLSAEFYVKIGLVLLGTSVIFGDVLKAGFLGLIQALIVVVSVWYFAFWICKKLKVDEDIALMLSSAVSICGVSAAIATSGAIEGDSKKLSYVVSLVLITAVPMMIFMPYLATWIGLSEAVTGAWIGGSIDTTGAVVASGSMVGEEALKISTIVKFSQNVLLGIAAFAISIYWAYSRSKKETVTQKPTLKLIWQRFPKFVIGFIIASLLFSFVVSPSQVTEVKGSLKSMQGLWFAMAFTSIGLETNFKDLFAHNNKKPLYAFLIAQTFNIVITLIIAYALFN